MRVGTDADEREREAEEKKDEIASSIELGNSMVEEESLRRLFNDSSREEGGSK